MHVSRNQFVIAQLTALCQEISAVILTYYNDSSRLHVRKKSNATPITEADLAAHQILVNSLPKIISLPVLSEESEYLSEIRYDDYWLIDPIDGTREFINKTGEFCISIARITHARPVLGYIFAPLTRQYWFALLHSGSYRGSEDGKVHRIYCRHYASPVRIMTYRGNLTKRMSTYLSNQFGQYEQCALGSALKFCYLSEGKADFYPKISRTTCEWDIAAGDIILHEAGGGIRFFDGTIPLYGLKSDPLNLPFFAYGAGLDETEIQHFCQYIYTFSQY